MHTKNKAKQKQKKKTEKDGTKKWPLSQGNIINRHLKVCGKQGEEEPKLERGEDKDGEDYEPRRVDEDTFVVRCVSFRLLALKLDANLSTRRNNNAYHILAP